MALPVFPTEIPKPSPRAYTLTRRPNFDRTDMDQGRARQRLRFADVPTTVRIEWELTWEQYKTFDSFVVFSVNFGASLFRMPVFVHDQFVTYDVRFTEAPRARYAGWNRWRVQAEVEIVEPTLTDADKALTNQSISAYVAFGDTRVAIGTLPINHTVTQVEARIVENFDGSANNLIDVGYQTSPDPDEYVDSLDLFLPATITTFVFTINSTTAAPPRGLQMNVAEAGAIDVVCDYDDSAGDAQHGRALVVVRYTTP